MWRTCLREITFLDDRGPFSSQRDELTGAEAYALLLEIICGLHSPIVGETQVFGQFRTFIASLTESHQRALADIGEQLISDARRVRERHLRGIGGGSYGAEVRRRLGGVDIVALIGRGALAQELRPYLEDCGTVHEWTREDVAAAASRSPVAAPSSLVVAAPVDGAAIGAVASCYSNLATVVDLRGPEERDPLPFPAVVTLADIFTAVEQSAVVSASRLAAAHAEIHERAHAFGARQLCRPFGWEDLCA